MRSLFSIIGLLYVVASQAQSWSSLEGTYKRYRHSHKKPDTEQTLVLTGVAAGRYTLTETGEAAPDFSSGYWKRMRIWSKHSDSLQVVALDYENEHEVRYYAIDPTGCLTRVYSDGYQVKRANSFAPVRKK